MGVYSGDRAVGVAGADAGATPSQIDEPGGFWSERRMGFHGGLLLRNEAGGPVKSRCACAVIMMMQMVIDYNWSNWVARCLSGERQAYSDGKMGWSLGCKLILISRKKTKLECRGRSVAGLPTPQSNEPPKKTMTGRQPAHCAGPCG